LLEGAACGGFVLGTMVQPILDLSDATLPPAGPTSVATQACQ
jgi:hypothetical protein